MKRRRVEPVDETESNYIPTKVKLEPMEIAPTAKRSRYPDHAPYGFTRMGTPLKRPLKKRRTGRSYRGRYAGYRRRYGGGGSYGRGSSSNIVISGRGDYTMDSNASFGTRYGGYLGSKAGEFLGGMAQRAFGSITGLGDYNVNKNVFLGGNLPQIMNESGGGGTVIRFQEYLGDIRTAPVSGDFKITAFNLNAGDSYTFPWLSQIAANYEQYEFEGVIFQFRSTSADALNSTNTALGSVMLATQYDFVEPPFDSKGQMLNYEFSTSCKPSENVMHMIECAPRMSTLNTMYTLTGALPPNADPRLYNLGRFHIATTGFQGTDVNIGELHVTYQVRLLKPKLNVTLGGVIDNYYSNNFGPAGTYSNAAPLGSVAANSAATVFDSMGITRTPTTLTFLRSITRQYYRLEVLWAGDTNTVIAFPVVTYTNCTLVNANSTPTAGANVTQCIYIAGFYTLGNGAIPNIVFGGAGALPITATNQGLTIRIMQVNPGELGL